jgi:putative endonuclease
MPFRGRLGGMTRAKDAVGAYGERVAVRYLLDQGMVLLARNWRCATGEIDAVLRDRGDVLVFVEVKTRRSERFGTPAAAVLPAKVVRLRRLAARWLSQARIHPHEVRFDVVEVLPQRSGPARVAHLRSAF